MERSDPAPQGPVCDGCGQPMATPPGRAKVQGGLCARCLGSLPVARPLVDKAGKVVGHVNGPPVAGSRHVRRRLLGFSRSKGGKHKGDPR